MVIHAAASALGTGITPHYQIIQHILRTKDSMNMSLLCANKTPDDVLLGPELAMLADKHPNQFKVASVASNGFASTPRRVGSSHCGERLD